MEDLYLNIITLIPAFIVITFFIINGFIGAVICREHGFILGFLLGPFGVMIGVLCDIRRKTEYEAGILKIMNDTLFKLSYLRKDMNELNNMVEKHRDHFDDYAEWMSDAMNTMHESITRVVDKTE